VYNINKTTAINIIDNQKNILFANFSGLDRNRIQNSAKNFWVRSGVSAEKYIDLASNRASLLSNLITIDSKNIFFKRKFIGFENRTVFVLDNDFCPADSISAIDVDFLVISNNPYIEMSDIPEYFTFKKIIIDASNYQKNVEKWLSEEVVFRDRIHDVRTKGAFVFEL
jgi:hypothetical protein